MPAVLLYSSVFALLLCIAGLAVERIASGLGLPRRGIWIVTIIASVALPWALILIPREPLPAAAIASLTPSVAAATESLIPRLAPTSIPLEVPRTGWIGGSASASASLNDICKSIWRAMSGLLFGILVFSWLRLRIGSGKWRLQSISGQDVYVTPALGPAVIGVIRPKILMPEWILEAPAITRSLALAHENEHISAHDPLLLLGALAAVLVMPWNVPLWWQLNRLRFALEVDCDARVLRGGVDVFSYGQVLLAVIQQGAAGRFGVMAIAAPMSRIERRVRIMTSRNVKSPRWSLGIAFGIAFACTALAMDLQVPSVPHSDLRRPPLHDWSPFLAKAEIAARAALPELFLGHFDGTVVLLVDLNREGKVLKIETRRFPAGPLADDALPFDAELMAALYHDQGAANRKFLGWFGPQHANGLYLYYEVLTWPRDPTRSAARVRSAVAGKYPQFFRDYPGVSTQEPANAKLLTVFMNDDGTINRERMDDVAAEESEKARFNRFIKLGLRAEQFGHRGWTSNFKSDHGLTRYDGVPELQISYAWPRYSSDPPDAAFLSGAIFRPAFDGFWKELDTRLPDALFLKRYFPDIWVKGATLSDNPWILLDHQGVVCDHGMARTADFLSDPDLKHRYPGALFGLDLRTATRTADGAGVNLTYLKVRDDSPLTTCQALFQARSRFTAQQRAGDGGGEPQAASVWSASMAAVSPTWVVQASQVTEDTSPLGPISAQNVRLSYGSAVIEADHAEATNLPIEGDRPKIVVDWKFSGHVRVRFASGEMRAESATAQFNSPYVTISSPDCHVRLDNDRGGRKATSPEGEHWTLLTATLIAMADNLDFPDAAAFIAFTPPGLSPIAPKQYGPLQYALPPRQ